MLLSYFEIKIFDECREFSMPEHKGLQDLLCASSLPCVFQHTLIAAPASGLLSSEMIVGSPSKAPLLYRGTGLIVDPENPLLLPILRSPSTAYSHDPIAPVADYPHATGQSVVLLAALQARNNARVLVSGSLEFFSDAFITAPVTTPQGEAFKESGNGRVVDAVTKWALKEAGVLRVVSVSHNKVCVRWIAERFYFMSLC